MNMKKEEYNKFENVVEYNDYIEQLLNEKPDKRKKTLYKEWLQEINHFAREANKLAKFPIYGIFK